MSLGWYLDNLNLNFGLFVNTLVAVEIFNVVS